MALNSKRIFSVIISAIILSTLFFINANASKNIDTLTAYNTEIICIAHRGDWHSYPENSAEAVKTASEYGLVSVDVRLTSDNEVVLMADPTTDRMCVDEKGSTVSGNVSDYTLSQLQEFCLRSANGTEKNGKTDFHPASLEDVLSVGDTELMLNTNCADFKSVYNKVKSLDELDRVIFRFSDSNNEILKTVGNISDINYCGNYQGNIVFLASDVINKCAEKNITTVELGSKNGHGVLYDNFLMKKFNSEQKAMVSMTGGRCGKRTDNEIGWDDLISRGYSVIETDYPQELSTYIKKAADVKADLSRYVSLYEDTDLTPYTSDTEKAFRTALSEAEKKIDKSSSLSELENARYNLQASFDNLTVGEKKAVTLAFDFTVGRAVAFVLCGGAVVAAQIFFYKRRETDKK
ncbi:MAG: glycerophosphodiester phosphodiesterase family protein [Clostridia bacterium]|nr:glycerophosphodiester phosphodiesterase family protein [Clostridia bacterium]